MTQPYKTIETSEDVYNAILKSHSESKDYLVLFSNVLTQPTGRESSIVDARRYSWGFPDATVPLIEMLVIHNKINEDERSFTCAYYLCYPIEDNDS